MELVLEVCLVVQDLSPEQCFPSVYIFIFLQLFS